MLHPAENFIQLKMKKKITLYCWMKEHLHNSFLMKYLEQIIKFLKFILFSINVLFIWIKKQFYTELKHETFQHRSNILNFLCLQNRHWFNHTQKKKLKVYKQINVETIYLKELNVIHSCD